MATTSKRFGLLVVLLTLGVIANNAASAQSRMSRGPAPGEKAAAALASIVTIAGEDADGRPVAPGRGFFVGRNVIATDYSVVRDAIRIRARTAAQLDLEAQIAGVDEQFQLAILTVAGALAAPPPIGDAAKLAVGDEVFRASGTNAVERDSIDDVVFVEGVQYVKLATQTTAGDRGAPVMNNLGEVIAIVAAGPGPGFAIPISRLSGLVFYKPGAHSGDSGYFRLASDPKGGRVVAESSSDAGPAQSQWGVLQGEAIRKCVPIYPPLALAARVSGAVVVELTVNEEGNVRSARAVSGPPLLRDSAVNAARGWKATPTKLSGVPVKVIGTITFNFVLGEKGSTPAEIGYVAPRLLPSAPLDRATEVDRKPRQLNRVFPRYTELARRHKVQGQVRARILVGADGVVKQVEIIEGLPDGLTEEAMRVAYRMQFSPAMKDGRAVEYWMPIAVEFYLR